MTFNMNSPKSSGYEDYEWAVKLNRISLKLLGIWPKTAQNFQDKLIWNLHILIVFLIITICLIIPCIHFLIRITSDIMLIVNNLIFTLPILTCLVRIAIFWWKKEGLMSIIIMIEEDWQKSKSTNERKMMITWAQRARIILTCGYCVMTIIFLVAMLPSYFGITTTYFMNITESGRLLPIPSYYMYDTTNGLQYEITYISQAVSLLIGGMAYIGVDNFLGLLVFHICGQLDILSHRLTQPRRFTDFYKFLKSTVINHIRLLRAITIVDDIYNIILFALFLYFIILFAFCGFLIINLLKEETGFSALRLIFLILMIIIALGHMLLYCAVGELLISQYDGMSYAIYNQQWYSLLPKDARCLISLMIRTQKPNYLTAGKIFFMTIPTFCSLVKTSTGYISVLLTTRN